MKMHTKKILQLARRFTPMVEKSMYWGIFTLLVSVAAIIGFSALPIRGGIQLLTVQSDSMSPHLKVGYIVAIQPKSMYSVGDVITFQNPEKTQQVTHRITGFESNSGSEMIITKGDANEDEDLARVSPDLVLGREIFALPYVGFLVAFAKKPVGFIVLVVVPATLYISNELLAIKKEITLLISRKAHA